MVTRAFTNTVRSRSTTSFLSSASLSTGWLDSLAMVQPCVLLAGSYRIAPALLNYSRLSFATKAAAEPFNNSPELAQKRKKQKLYLELEEKDYKDILAVLQNGGQGGAYKKLNAARLPDDVIVQKKFRPLPMEKILEFRKKAGNFEVPKFGIPAAVIEERQRERRLWRGEMTSEDEE